MWGQNGFVYCIYTHIHTKAGKYHTLISAINMCIYLLKIINAINSICFFFNSWSIYANVFFSIFYWCVRVVQIKYLFYKTLFYNLVRVFCVDCFFMAFPNSTNIYKSMTKNILYSMITFTWSLFYNNYVIIL